MRFDGRRIPLHNGDTIGSALHREGVLEISRSLKYHRPRGLYCNAGSCASCLVEVDGVPNVTACTEIAEDGMEVESQNVMGSPKRDLFAITDKVYRKGFDPHGAFTRPRILNAAFLKAVRFMSGVGTVPDAPGDVRPKAYQESCDELIVGAGRIGIARARAAAQQGKRIIIVDEAEALGGSSRWDPDEADVLAAAETVHTLPGVEAWTDAVVFGMYEDGVGIRHGDDLVIVTAKRVTVCSGHHDGVPLFPNNDLPGILTLRATQRLVHGHGVMPGEVIVSDAPLPKPLLDAMPDVIIAATGEVSGAKGGTRVEQACVDGRWVPCDAIIVTPPRTPRMELLQQAGCSLTITGGALAAKHTKTGKTDVSGVYVGVA